MSHIKGWLACETPEAPEAECFRHVLVQRGPRADPGLAGEIVSLSWFGKAPVNLEEMAETQTWISSRLGVYMYRNLLVAKHLSDLLVSLFMTRMQFQCIFFIDEAFEFPEIPDLISNHCSNF